ncbi:MAG: glutamate--tRNA ligase [Rickettsiales bacterium]|jgi:glutamyl-tRNA synthetase|nr:glutamate--tRNA ligase [Rickettsiales bacterium]
MELARTLADAIFPENLPGMEDIFALYPRRVLEDGQRVTRYAPSPTGFMHIGNLYSALVSERVAHVSGGIFFLRIEDTDSKREVEGALDKIFGALDHFGLKYDEATFHSEDIGSYGPYVQSRRASIYKVFARELVLRELAYPCFCSEEELENIVGRQKIQGCQKLGYYGSWAKYRNSSIQESIDKIKAGEKYALRFRSPGNFDRKIVINDMLRGNIEYPENDLDIVLLKQNFLPTYHFAHVVDDCLMGTNLVLRGDEWLPSLPLHIQLFRALGWKPPKYAHISPLMKTEGTSKRKLSKRKDPEADVEYFDRAGYPKDSVIEYLINIANSNFEDWRRQNPGRHYNDFPFDIKKMNVSGALFDFVKLDSIAKNVIAKMTAEEVYENVLIWAKKYDATLEKLLENHRKMAISIFSIERQGTKNVRKDIAKWSEIMEEIDYFFVLDEALVERKLQNLDSGDIVKIAKLFLSSYVPENVKENWFGEIKSVARCCGYADNSKDFRENPENFRGSISDVTKIIRILLTAREEGPDLYSIMNVLGPEDVRKRIGRFL